MDVDWNLMGKKLLSIHPSTSIHPSIHPLFLTLANFLIMQIRDEEKEHKRNCSDTKSWQHFRAKEKKLAAAAEEGLGRRNGKAKNNRKDPSSSSFSSSSSLSSFACWNIWMQTEYFTSQNRRSLLKTSVCQEGGISFFVGCIFLKYKTLPNFGGVLNFWVVCTIGTQEEELW